MRSPSWLAPLLVALALGLAVNAVLGPLWLEVIEYRYSETVLNQAIGLDAVSLFVAAPLALASARLALTQRQAGPILALAPSAYALYMMPQYVIGPEYGVVDGNNERFFALHFGLFIVAGGVFVLAWNAIEPVAVRTFSRGRRRAAIAFLLGFPVFLAVAMYGANLADALSSSPSRSEYLDNPTAFWVIAFLDLAVVAPLAAASGVALLRGREWAIRGVLAVVGWFALVPPSVAAMAIVMVANDDPNASMAGAVAFSAFACAFAGFATWFYAPLLSEWRPHTGSNAHPLVVRKEG